MTYIRWKVATALALAVPFLSVGRAFAQSATVTLGSQKQYIRGYGGIAHAAWVGDLTAAERTLAFGNADGQLGFSVLRIPVTDGNPDSVNVATAKAALANGAVVFATPWNAAKTYTSADFATYATHLNNFVSYMNNQGVPLYAISVQNEPDYGATAGWGSWTAAACHDFVLNYGATITTKLMSCESFNYAKSYYDPILNDSAALANVAVFGTHIYGTPVSAYAYPLFDQKAGGRERWMTEHYTDSTTDANSWPNALGVASELHNAMVTGQFNAYVWWAIKRSYGPINNGAVTKRGYCMGQWSKFVRPGFYRVDATASPTSGVALSAYKNDTDVVIVVVNTNTTATPITVTVTGSSISSYARFTTSSSKSLASDGNVTVANGSLSVSLDASSVTTLHGTGAATGSGGSGGAGGSSGVGGSGGVSGSANAGGSSGVGGASGIGGAGGGSGGGGYSGVGGSDAVGGSNNGTAGSISVGGASGVAGSNTGVGGQNVAGAGGAATGAAAGSGGATGGSEQGSGGDAALGSRSNAPPGCSCETVGIAQTDWSSFSPLLLGLIGLASRRRRSR